MITDAQVRKLRQLLGEGHPLYRAALKVGMDTKSARKYRQADRLPSESITPRTWRTREDPFQDVWPQLRGLLELNPGLQAKTLFEDLQRRFPGRFPDIQLRTLQRKIKAWRATEGPPKEVFFDQIHQPGQLAASDFTHMNDLGITLAGQPFDHMIYHFVLTYSNWETGTVCFSESFESLSQGLQNALWELGEVPEMHRTDRLTAAVNNLGDRELFQQHYLALLAHYGLKAQVFVFSGQGSERRGQELPGRRGVGMRPARRRNPESVAGRSSPGWSAAPTRSCLPRSCSRTTPSARSRPGRERPFRAVVRRLRRRVVQAAQNDSAAFTNPIPDRNVSWLSPLFYKQPVQPRLQVATLPEELLFAKVRTVLPEGVDHREQQLPLVEVAWVFGVRPAALRRSS